MPTYGQIFHPRGSVREAVSLRRVQWYQSLLRLSFVKDDKKYLKNTQ